MGITAAGGAAASLAIAQIPNRTVEPARRGIGGEPYLRDGGPSDSRTRVTRDLILFDGCLRVFDELLAAQAWPEARQRIDDATLDYREKLEPYMKGQSVKPFTPLVESMSRVLLARNGAAARRGREAIQARLVEADRALRKFRLPYHQFGLRGAIEALKVAAKSYASAYAVPDQPETADYQDGRGAFAAVRATVALVADDLRRIDPEAAERVLAGLGGLEPVWPTLAAPPSPPLSPDAVDALVEAIETAAAAFWPKATGP
jgi:hypothetical protein